MVSCRRAALQGRLGASQGGHGMPRYRSHRTTQGRTQMVARALWRATGTAEADLAKPIVAIANSYTQFVPGHVHLKPLGDLVAEEIHRAGAVAKEFHTIAVDDGIAMGHEGMLYSLPSRELIADGVEYMVNAHCADALVCISNCDKITPGMLMAALRLNIPTVFVSGGPMEAGLALPGNGTTLATHAARRGLFERAGQLVVELAQRYYEGDDESVLPRSVATRDAFENAMALDVAMGGSTNTILHLLAAAHEARVGFGLKEIDELSRRVPCLCKVAPSSSYHVEDVHRVHSPSLRAFLDQWDIRSETVSPAARELFHAAPGGIRTIRPYSQDARWSGLDEDRAEGCIRDRQHAYSADGGLAVLYGNLAPEGAIVKT